MIHLELCFPKNISVINMMANVSVRQELLGIIALSVLLAFTNIHNALVSTLCNHLHYTQYTTHIKYITNCNLILHYY